MDFFEEELTQDEMKKEMIIGRGYKYAFWAMLAALMVEMFVCIGLDEKLSDYFIVATLSVLALGCLVQRSYCILNGVALRENQKEKTEFIWTIIGAVFLDALWVVMDLIPRSWEHALFIDGVGARTILASYWTVLAIVWIVRRYIVKKKNHE